jgi:hypothetical protein
MVIGAKFHITNSVVHFAPLEPIINMGVAKGVVTGSTHISWPS